MNTRASSSPMLGVPRRLSRRQFLTVAGVAGGALLADQEPLAADSANDDATARRQLVFATRRDAARVYRGERDGAKLANGDEARYADHRASFTKTLPHDELGEVDRSAFTRFVATLQRGQSAEFDHLVRDPQAEIRLNDPQAAYSL